MRSSNPKHRVLGNSLGRIRTLLCTAVLLWSLGACSEPSYRKRTFVGQTAAGDTTDTPVGLNPLGTAEVCREQGGSAAANSSRAAPTRTVLVSHPEWFTAEASLMISALRDALAEGEAPQHVEFLLSETPLRSQGEAVRVGRHCNALLVLWEPTQSRTLRLTLPQPSRIPLKVRASEEFCEFGSQSEQAQILFFTIAGLLALQDKDYVQAVQFISAARRLDHNCLNLPITEPPTPPGPLGPQGGSLPPDRVLQ